MTTGKSIVISIHRGSQLMHRREVGTQPVALGRGPMNDVVLVDDQMSWQHAMVWVEDGVLRVRDLGSTNGTFRGKDRVTGVVQLATGDTVRFGDSVELRVGASVASGDSRMLMLEDVAAGVRFPIAGDRFHIGSESGADLRWDGVIERLATLSVFEDEVWLGTDSDERALAVGELFELAGRELRLVEAAGRLPTVRLGDRYPYALSVGLDGPTGAFARFEHSGQEHVMRSENRVSLLYVLAKRVVDERAAGVAVADSGWCSDEEVAIGVWGRRWEAKVHNDLHVLVHRVRAELKKAGLDPWFLEKKRRRLRVRLDEVALS